ncbi:hypothetical protein EUTSA_v10005158mg [Eutrema salsugineum]|uniref:Prolamin-like domain-containing protein n=1 Tax=Eutrema salsugineum TaxID=72664 RepID=V4KMT0_EUTSA|nr:egg cell-secreted protein 1.4 [Eutrema salsugineum]ESQ32579.1 hypothetical protein EUTSA_v10005158mg [Eutrema salsugineum]
MENTSRALVLALVLCVAVLITPLAAHDQPPSKTPPSSPIDIEKCWSSLFNVNGCILEVFQSVFSGKFGIVGISCCKAFSTIDTNCWPHMFPFNPFFPPLLKDSCVQIVPNSPAHK